MVKELSKCGEPYYKEMVKQFGQEILLENKEKTLLLEQKKDQTEEIYQLKEKLDQEKKDHLNEIEKLKNELEKEKNKGFFARLFGK